MGGVRGVLYLIPNLLDAGSLPEAVLPAVAIERVRSLSRFVVEGEKAAWRLLSRILDPERAAKVRMERLDEHTLRGDLPSLLAPLEAGEDLGLIPEAGMPCIADPGAALSALAHDRGFAVVPLVGPSSIIMALAASGLDGQLFNFLGYLPPEPRERRAALAAVDRALRSDGATRIFIETPYRNARLLEDCLRVLSSRDPALRRRLADLAVPEDPLGPRLGLAIDPWPLGKEPAIFLAGLSAPVGLDRSSARRQY